jgi:hypothetical protein
MAFIRKRPSDMNGTRFSHTLIESYVSEKGPRHRNLANLGPHSSIEERIAWLVGQAEELQRDLKDVEIRQARLAWVHSEIEKLERLRADLIDKAGKRRRPAA